MTARADDAPSPRARVALIFDDGPVAAQTEQFLEVLAQAQARVSFAYVGREVAKMPHLAEAAARAGHEIVNHSYTHPHFKELDDAAIAQEVRDTQQAIGMAGAPTPRWFWAPFGDWDARIERAVRAGGLEHLPVQGVRIISTDDWNREIPAEEIRRRATTGISGPTLIVCHEWREATLAELPAILAELKRQGCELVTVSELVAAAPQ